MRDIYSIVLFRVLNIIYFEQLSWSSQKYNVYSSEKTLCKKFFYYKQKFCRLGSLTIIFNCNQNISYLPFVLDYQFVKNFVSSMSLAQMTFREQKTAIKFKILPNY